ncbi:type I-E CRISPR-associated protein Cas7/Cse4/CasC [Aminobacterium mobile]|uniref:type I-E CRISPR-associated protein Cas7/Cse4/CasC n=1 Tax=Aminobacterium mobile TaxID=81467 RepID=UPI003315BE7C
MNDNGIKIEVHLIQNFAPSNLNRDDTGQPKSAFFGGVRRARISSQCGKRATRQWWRGNGIIAVGERTKLLKTKLFNHLKVEGRTDEQIGKAVDTFISQFYSKMDGNKTAVPIFVSRNEINEAQRLIEQHWEILSEGEKLGPKDYKEVSNTLDKAMLSADIALFGRMLAEQPGRNTDGSCQVAHPISTHKVDMEMDFYTAVDDLNPEGETGASMMGVVGFNSACFYRYAVIDRDQLARNLARKTDRKNGTWVENLTKEDFQEADKVIKAFLEAMVYAIPTGKQNSFAAQNLPSFGLFIKRQGGIPISLANAFAKPVRANRNDDDLIGLSVERLTTHWQDLQKCYGNQGVVNTTCFHIGQETRLNALSTSDRGSVEAAIDAVMEDAKQ